MKKKEVLEEKGMATSVDVQACDPRERFWTALIYRGSSGAADSLVSGCALNPNSDVFKNH